MTSVQDGCTDVVADSESPAAMEDVLFVVVGNGAVGAFAVGDFVWREFDFLIDAASVSEVSLLVFLDALCGFPLGVERFFFPSGARAVAYLVACDVFYFHILDV